MTEPKLKPCPFCGGKAIMVFRGGGDYWYDEYSAYCTKCGAETDNYEFADDVVKAWNRRVESDTE